MPIHSRRRGIKKHIRQAQVLELYEPGGMTQPQIAALLGVDKSTISRDIAEIDDRRIERAVDTLEERRNREVAILKATRLEALDAWRRSIGENIKAREEYERVVGDNADNADNAGVEVLVKRIEESTELVGDARFLDVAIKCTQEIVKLEGLYAAERRDVSGTVKTESNVTFDYSKLGTEQLIQLIAIAESVQPEDGTGTA